MRFAKLLLELARWMGSSNTEFDEGKIDGSSTTIEKPMGAKCFIIEDEPGIRHFLLHVLRRRGVNVTEFSGASEVSQCVARECPQLIFLD
jgi:response regulator RpfG family c-di-GMP phosphodiesterase